MTRDEMAERIFIGIAGSGGPLTPHVARAYEAADAFIAERAKRVSKPKLALSVDQLHGLAADARTAGHFALAEAALAMVKELQALERPAPGDAAPAPTAGP